MNYLEFFTSQDPLLVLVTLVVAFVVGILIFAVYKWTFAGVMYSRNFNMSLVLLTVVTALMLMLINNNLTLSLGMVGALSIIRFRTAIKDPIDTVFMFWAVGEGIAIGTRFFGVALISWIIITIVLILMHIFRGKGTMPYLLVIHYDEAAAQQIKQLTKQLPGARLKSKTVRPDGIEVTYEIRIRQEDSGFVEKFMRVDGIYDISLISHQGDIVS